LGCRDRKNIEFRASRLGRDLEGRLGMERKKGRRGGKGWRMKVCAYF
jgi:hypothetical protein